MGTESQHRRSAVVALGGGMFLLLLVLAALNAFNPLPPFLRPHGSGQIFLFTALSVLAFLLLLTLLVLLFRNIVKLLADQRSRVLGSRIRSRMLVGALLLSFAPAVFMFLFSFGLLNRSMERWFSQPASQMRQDSTLVSLELSQYAAANARAEAESLASSPSLIHCSANRKFRSPAAGNRNPPHHPRGRVCVGLPQRRGDRTISAAPGQWPGDHSFLDG